VKHDTSASQSEGAQGNRDMALPIPVATFLVLHIHIMVSLIAMSVGCDRAIAYHEAIELVFFQKLATT